MYADSAHDRRNQDNSDNTIYAEIIARKLYALWKKICPILSRPSFEYLLVGIVLLLIAIQLTGGVIFHASTELFTSGIGDGTSGFTWALFAQDHLPLFSQFTHLVNYPFGDNSIGLTYVTWSMIYAPLYVLARMFSSLVAINIMTLVGFVTCGLAMYILIKKLTGKWYIAFVAAYAASFTPYHMMNATTHLTNVFSWVFVATIGCFVAFWSKQTVKRGALLAAVIASSAYTDGYFVFIESVLLLALLIAVLVSDILLGDSMHITLRRIRGLCFVAVGALILLTPVALVELNSASQIQQGLNNDRSNIKSEVATYSVQFIDLLVPGQGNVLVGDTAWFQHYGYIKNSHSNSVENTNYVGYTIFLLFTGALAYSAATIWRKWRSGGVKYSNSDRIMLTCIIATPLALIWMLPPVLFGIKMPIGYLTDYVAYWRVPARVFLAMQPLMVIAATLALNKFINNKRYKTNICILIAGVWFCLLALEYNINVNLPAFGYKNMPQVYSWLAKQKDVNAIAEIPMVDRPLEITGYYVFGQMISGKPIINDQVSAMAPGQYNTLGDLSNPETINFIRSRNVDTIVDHTNKCNEYDWGSLIYKEKNVLSPPFMDGVGTTICVYHLNSTTTPDPYFAYAENGFQVIDYRDPSVRYWLILGDNHPTIRVVDNQGRFITNGNAKARFTSELSFVGKAPMKQLNWTISQGNKVVASGSGVQDTTMSATINASEPINIQVTTDSWHRVPNSGEIDMRAVEVTKM